MRKFALVLMVVCVCFLPLSSENAVAYDFHDRPDIGSNDGFIQFLNSSGEERLYAFSTSLHNDWRYVYGGCGALLEPTLWRYCSPPNGTAFVYSGGSWQVDNNFEGWAGITKMTIDTSESLSSQILTNVDIYAGYNHTWSAWGLGYKNLGDVVFSANYSPSNEADHFTWPVDPTNLSTGHYGSCYNDTCYWLSDVDENIDTVWRDVQPFQFDKYKGKYHLGADYNLGGSDDDLGEPIYPTAVGKISNVLENVCGFGNIIFVKHETSFGTYTSVYAHVDWLESGKPNIDDEVSPSLPIAYIGKGCWNNNACKGKKHDCYSAHLHFEIREGDNTYPGLAYSKDQVEKGAEGQIDPNAFISSHR